MQLNKLKLVYYFKKVNVYLLKHYNVHTTMYKNKLKKNVVWYFSNVQDFFYKYVMKSRTRKDMLQVILRGQSATDRREAVGDS